MFVSITHMTDNKCIDTYKNRCDCCIKTGDRMFARIFYRKIKGKWMYLCSICWEKY